MDSTARRVLEQNQHHPAVMALVNLLIDRDAETQGGIDDEKTITALRTHVALLEAVAVAAEGLTDLVNEPPLTDCSGLWKTSCEVATERLTAASESRRRAG